MPQFELEDGLYYLRATSLLHHQAMDVSPEFAVSGVVLLDVEVLGIFDCGGGVVVVMRWCGGTADALVMFVVVLVC